MSRNDYAIMAILKTAVMIHRMAHWLGLNLGYAVYARDRVWVGYRCVKCGKVSGVRMVRRASAPKPDEFS